MGSRTRRGPSPSASATCASIAGIMKPVQETLTTRSISPGSSPAEASARRARSTAMVRAWCAKRSFCVSKSPGKKTSSIGTTLARVSTPAVA